MNYLIRHLYYSVHNKILYSFIYFSLRCSSQIHILHESLSNIGKIQQNLARANEANTLQIIEPQSL